MRVQSVDESSVFCFEKRPESFEWLAFERLDAPAPLLRLHWRFLFLPSALEDDALFERALLAAAYTIPLLADEVAALRASYPALPARARYNPKFLGRAPPPQRRSPPTPAAALERAPEREPAARLRNGRRIILKRGP